jgi:hypothetical protein
MPATRISVIVLQNSDRAHGIVDPTESARKLAAFALGDPYDVPQPIAVDVAALHQAEGIYGSDPPGPSFARTRGALVLCLIGQTLTVARTGEARSALISIATDTFRSRDGFDRLHLERNADGHIAALRFFPWNEGKGRLLGRTMGVRSAPQLPPTDPVAIDHYTGDYSVDEMTLHVFVDGLQLKAALGPTSIATLEPTSSPATFVVVEVDATVEFAASDESIIARLHQGREFIEFKRVRRPGNK